MNHIKRIRLFEIALYASILLIVFCFPLFDGLLEHSGWSDVLKSWVRISPFILVFLINNYIFIPKLFLSEKYLYFIFSSILSVMVVVYLSHLLIGVFPPLQQPLEGMPFFELPPLSHRKPDIVYFVLTVVSIMMIGFNAGVKSFVRWNEERTLQADRESQFLQTELAYLKFQISPHFFMNTLNNIHALIEIEAEKARDAVVKLSRLMRYLLYETDVQNVSLKKEIEFIESYIELMRLRYDEEVLTVETKYPVSTEDISVPSFLFLSFIENAFKHGVNLHIRSLIRIRFVHKNGRLAFTVCNNKSGIVSAITDSSGIGLENVQKRLNLIFKDDYKLEIHSTDNTYEINLNIPV